MWTFIITLAILFTGWTIIEIINAPTLTEDEDEFIENLKK